MGWEQRFGALIELAGDEWDAAHKRLIREFHCGRLLDNFPEIVRRLRGMLERFMEALSCIDQCFIGDEMLERLPLPSRVGKSMVGGY